jgi:putative transposase
MFYRHPEHLKTFDYIGPHRYFLTFCTSQRRPLLVDAVAIQLVKEQIVRAARDHRFSIPAYCFMPDHLHLLVFAETNDGDGKRFISRAKQYSGFYYARAYGGPLWQRYGYERVLRSDEVTIAVAKYIFRNPVRAGLANTVRDYPYLGSEVFSVEAVMQADQSG